MGASESEEGNPKHGTLREMATKQDRGMCVCNHLDEADDRGREQPIGSPHFL